jgi:Domain of unknown function (DUF4388)
MQTTLDTEAEAEADLGPDGFQVRIDGVSLVDLLQMFHLSRRSVTLKLPQGKLHIRDGEVIHAEYGGATGELAVRKMLELRGGELETDSLTSTPVSVRRPLASVLLDALVSLDEEHEGVPAFMREQANDTYADGEPVQTRVAQLDAICGNINQNVEGALCCVIVDLERAMLLGCDEKVQLPNIGHEMLLDTTLSLFARGQLPSLEALLDEDSNEAHSQTRELCIAHGDHLYLGRRLNENSAILVIANPTSAPTVHLAQLRAALSRGAPNQG